MSKIHTKVCWLLLSVMISLMGMVMSVGQSEARYQDTVIWNTVVTSQSVGVISDYLIGNDEAPLTVLVGELPLQNQTMVSFGLKSLGEDAKGKLAWSVKEEGYAQYLDIFMRSGPENIALNTELELIADVQMDISMVLMPTEIARSTEHEELIINVLVTWGDNMWGTFQVILPEVKAPEETTGDENGQTEPVGGNNQGKDPVEPTEPSDPVREDPMVPDAQNLEEPLESDEEQQTQSNQTDMPVSDEGITQGDGKAADENAENIVMLAAENADTTTDAAEPENAEESPADAPEDEPENTDEEPRIPEDEPENPNEEPDIPEEEPENPEDDSSGNPDAVPDEGDTEREDPSETPEENDDPEDPSSDEKTEENPESPIQMKTIGNFDLSHQLPVVLKLEENVTSIRLGLKGQPAKEGDRTLVPFPDNTRLSLNQGSSYYSMYNGYICEFALQEMTSLPLLLDFSHTTLQADKELTLAMEAYAGDELLAVCEATTVINAQVFCQVHPESLLEEEAQQEESGSEGTAQPDAQLLTDESPARYVLDQDTFLRFTFPESWKEADLEYSVEFLTLTEDQELEYTTVTLSTQALSAEYTEDEDKHTLIFKIGETLPQAGTYRVNIKWSFEEICYAQTQTTFFINYSDYTSYNLSSQEVPENDGNTEENQGV